MCTILHNAGLSLCNSFTQNLFFKAGRSSSSLMQYFQLQQQNNCTVAIFPIARAVSMQSTPTKQHIASTRVFNVCQHTLFFRINVAYKIKDRFYTTYTSTQSSGSIQRSIQLSPAYIISPIYQSAYIYQSQYISQHDTYQSQHYSSA